jgi:hypothetical protein
MSGADLIHWLGFTLGYQYCPPFLLKWFWQHEPQSRLDLTIEERLELLIRRSSSANEKDLEHLKDKDLLRLTLRSTQESFKYGFNAVVQDKKLMTTN